MECTVSAKPTFTSAFDWAWGQDLAPAARVVLCTLAQQADAQGRCARRVQDLAALCRLCTRAMRNILVSLEGKGFIARDAKNGVASSYVLAGFPTEAQVTEAENAAVECAAVECAAVECAAVATASRAGVLEVKKESKKESKEGSVPPVAPKAVALPEKPARASRAGRRPMLPLPDDWEPAEPEQAFARGLGLDPNAVAAEFRDFWHGVDGRKADWAATFRNRCRDRAERQAGRRAQTPAYDPLARKRAQDQAMLALLNEDRRGAFN